MSDQKGFFECDACEHRFADSHALQQHQRHSRRCRAIAYRKSQDLEFIAKVQMRKTIEQREEELRRTVENIEVIAKAFGSRGQVKAHERAMFAIGALDTIKNLATLALTGVKDGTDN
jgi:hypothetical protein